MCEPLHSQSGSARALANWPLSTAQRERGDTQFFQLDGLLETSHVGLLLRAVSPLMSAKCLQSSPFSVLDCLFDLSPRRSEITMGHKFQLELRIIIEIYAQMCRPKNYDLNFCAEIIARPEWKILKDAYS
jgi:hypothetical protein